jgi:hypothetical protein
MTSEGRADVRAAVEPPAGGEQVGAFVGGAPVLDVVDGLDVVVVDRADVEVVAARVEDVEAAESSSPLHPANANANATATAPLRTLRIAAR